MRRWGMVLLVLAACGGEPVKQKCEVDRNCVQGFQCIAVLCEPVGTGGGGGDAGMGGGGGGGDAGTGGGGGTVSCAGVSCAGWRECRSDGGVAECVDVVTDVKFVLPDAGARFARNATFVAQVDAGVAPPSEAVPFQVACGSSQLMGASGVLTSWNVQVSGTATEGDCELTAGWTDGGPMDTRKVWVDLTNPDVSLLPQSVPVRPSDAGWVDPMKWRRDERPMVLVSATEVCDQPMPSTTQPVSNLLVRETSPGTGSVLWGATDGHLWQGVLTGGAWTGTPSEVTPDGGVASGGAINGLAPVDQGVSEVFVSGGANIGTLRRLNLSTKQVTSTGMMGGFSPAAVMTANDLWAGSNTNLSRYNGMLGSVGTPTSGAYLGSPVIGS